MMSDFSTMASVTNKLWLFHDIASTYKEVEIKFNATFII